MGGPNPLSGEIIVDEIDDTGRLREIDPAWAEALAAAIETNGQEQPVVVRRPANYEEIKRPFVLVIGGHRLAAARLLGWKSIRAEIRDYDLLHARLAEVDENLVRHELNPLDRAMFFAERRRVWDLLHPEARQGGDRKSLRAKEEIKLQGLQLGRRRFAEEAAERCGFGPRTVYAALALAAALSPDVIAVIRGTALARNAAELKRLAAQPRKRQPVLAALVVDGTAENVAHACIVAGDTPAGEGDPQEIVFRKLVAGWSKASAATRRRFLAHAGLSEARGGRS